jgi:hypothetical protein
VSLCAQLVVKVRVLSASNVKTPREMARENWFGEHSVFDASNLSVPIEAA